MTMTKDTRRWYGGQIAAARRESNRADARMFKLLDQYTARACPLARGDIVVITKLGQRHFYMVFRVDSDQKDSQPVPHWSAVARRCTKDGAHRYGTRHFAQADWQDEMLFKKAAS